MCRIRAHMERQARTFSKMNYTNGRQGYNVMVKLHENAADMCICMCVYVCAHSVCQLWQSNIIASALCCVRLFVPVLLRAFPAYCTPRLVSVVAADIPAAAARAKHFP